MNSWRNILLWVSYDFANSIIMIVFFLYFSQWVVIDQGLPDLYFNITYTITAIILLLTVPVTGRLLDNNLTRITGLRITSVIMTILYGLCAWATLNNQAYFALVFFTLASYVYLLSFTFYTPLITSICDSSKIGLVSGLGIAGNYLGQISGLVLALPFANGSISFFQANTRAETLPPAVLTFAVLTLPMLLFFTEYKDRQPAIKTNAALKQTLLATKELLKSPSVLAFLVAYFFFNDAVITASNNFSIYLEQVWKISDHTKTMLLLAVFVTCAIGGVLSGHLADRIGHKNTLLIILYGWLVILPVLALVHTFNIFACVTIVFGLWYGANWAISRSVMSYLAPAQNNNLAFAYFGLAERASTLLGPLFWSLLVSDIFYSDDRRYRLAMLCMPIFIIIGLIVMQRVKNDRF